MPHCLLTNLLSLQNIRYWVYAGMFSLTSWYLSCPQLQKLLVSRMISLISRFYDPLGFLSPFHFFNVSTSSGLSQFTWVLQSSCISSLNLMVMEELTTDLLKSKPIAIDRYYSTEHEDTVQYQDVLQTLRSASAGLKVQRRVGSHLYKTALMKSND